MSSIDDATASPYSDALLLKNYSAEFYQISMVPYTSYSLSDYQGKEKCSFHKCIKKNMKCPFCNYESTKVIDSRPADDNSSIRRRRECEECGKRFTTYEKVETIPLVVVKKDNTREPFDRRKIEAGVMRACHKRPVSVSQMQNLVDEVENAVYSMEEKEISSKVIGELVMDKLKDLEAVAYIRFASVYREFKDVNTFVEELKNFLDK